MSKKVVEYLNLNITFDGEPLLSRFEDIFMPAISKNYLRCKSFKYVFSNLEIKKFEGEYVLSGILIKDTVLEVMTVLDDDKETLIDKDDKIKSSPYSIFVLFLKDHRMLLVKNQKGSPNINNLKTALKDNLNKYIRDKNRSIKKEIREEIKRASNHEIIIKKSVIQKYTNDNETFPKKETKHKLEERINIEFDKRRIPFPVIDIMGLPSKEELNKLLKNSTIKNVKFRLSPRNFGEIKGYANFFDMMDQKLVDNPSSKSVDIKINNPENNDEIKNIVVETEDLVDTSITVIKENGEKETLTPDKYMKTAEIDFTNDTREGKIDELLAASKFLNLNRRKDSHCEYDSYIENIERVITQYGRK